MGIWQSTPLKPYYDIKPKDILFPEDETDGSDSDDMPYDLDLLEVTPRGNPNPFLNDILDPS